MVSKPASATRSPCGFSAFCIKVRRARRVGPSAAAMTARAVPQRKRANKESSTRRKAPALSGLSCGSCCRWRAASRRPVMASRSGSASSSAASPTAFSASSPIPSVCSPSRRRAREGNEEAARCSAMKCAASAAAVEGKFSCRSAILFVKISCVSSRKLITL